MGLEGHVGCKRRHRQPMWVSLAVAQDAPGNVQPTRARGLQGHWRCVWSKFLIFADNQVLVVLCTYIHTYSVLLLPRAMADSASPARDLCLRLVLFSARCMILFLWRLAMQLKRGLAGSVSVAGGTNDPLGYSRRRVSSSPFTVSMRDLGVLAQAG